MDTMWHEHLVKLRERSAFGGNVDPVASGGASVRQRLSCSAWNGPAGLQHPEPAYNRERQRRLGSDKKFIAFDNGRKRPSAGAQRCLRRRDDDVQHAAPGLLVS